MKLKYFYKFMRSGYKFWKFRKTCQRIDQMAERKIKIVFMWLLNKISGKLKRKPEFNPLYKIKKVSSSKRL